MRKVGGRGEWQDARAAVEEEGANNSWRVVHTHYLAAAHHTHPARSGKLQRNAPATMLGQAWPGLD